MVSLLLLQSGPLPEVSGWGSYIKVLLVLAGMLALCYAALRFLGARRGFAPGKSREGHLEVLDRLSLEPRRGIYLMRASDEYFLLASSEHGIEAIGKLSSPPRARSNEP